MKTCGGCGETKERSEYHKHRRHKDGLQPWCKVCMIQKAAEQTASGYHDERYWKKLSPETHRLHRRLTKMLERSTDPAKFAMRVWLWLLLPHDQAVKAWSGYYGKADDIIFHAEDEGLVDDFLSTSMLNTLRTVSDRSVAARWCRLLRTNYR